MGSDTLSGGYLGARGARGWLFVGFVMGFAAVIAACWILFADFVAAGIRLLIVCDNSIIDFYHPNSINLIF